MSAPKSLGKIETYEYGRRRLGYGDWDEHTATEPYHKWVGMAAHRLFLTMNKRRVTSEEFCLAVDYCVRHRIAAPNPVWILKHIPAARKEAIELAVLHQPEELELAIDQAIESERTSPDADTPDWVQRLVRARGPYRKEVLEEWKAQRLARFT